MKFSENEAVLILRDGELQKVLYGTLNKDEHKRALKALVLLCPDNGEGLADISTLNESAVKILLGWLISLIKNEETLVQVAQDALPGLSDESLQQVLGALEERVFTNLVRYADLETWKREDKRLQEREHTPETAED